MTAPLVLDPFEQEVTLADEPRVLSFGARAFSVPMVELMRHLSFDLVGAIPRPLGQLREPLAPGLEFETAFFQVGESVLAINTEIELVDGRHRVLELLGLSEDLRLRLNLWEPRGALRPDLPALASAELDEGRSLGQVRVWGNEPSLVAETRRTLGRQLHTLGLDTRTLERSVCEPVYVPPAGDRLTLEALPHDDLKVTEILLALLRQMPVETANKRAPRQISTHKDRIRRKGAIVSYAYETHRAGTGVLHSRRREVEAGAERPGLVRTFVLAGLRGGSRLRIRDVGGRVSAEFAGTGEAVQAIRKSLVFAMGGHG